MDIQDRWRKRHLPTEKEILLDKLECKLRADWTKEEYLALLVLSLTTIRRLIDDVTDLRRSLEPHTQAQ